MQTTKRNRRDYRRKPTTDELKSLTSFSFKQTDNEDLRVSFSKTHTDDPNRTAAWNATVCRTTNGTRQTATVYAGTDNTLPKRWTETLSKIREKAERL